MSEDKREGLVPGFEAGLEQARLKRQLAEQAAELQEYKLRCERIQRFLSTRPDEVKRLGEAELSDVIERDKKLCELERRLRAREETIERRQAELDRTQASREAALDQRSAALDLEQKQVAERARSLEAELERWKRGAETALAREFEAGKQAKDAEANVKLLTHKLRLLELETAGLRDRLEAWEKKAREIETERQDLKGQRQLLAAMEASLNAREKALEDREAQLERDHAQRRESLDRVKERMREEIAELTRQYRRQD